MGATVNCLVELNGAPVIVASTETEAKRGEATISLVCYIDQLRNGPIIPSAIRMFSRYMKLFLTYLQARI